MAGELAEAAAFGVAEGAGGEVGAKVVDGLFNKSEGSGSASASSTASIQNTNARSIDQGSDSTPYFLGPAAMWIINKYDRKSDF